MRGISRHLYGILNREALPTEAIFLPAFFNGYDNGEGRGVLRMVSRQRRWVRRMAAVAAATAVLCPTGLGWAAPESVLWLEGLREAFQGWRTQQVMAPSATEEAAHLSELWTWLVRTHGPAASPTLAETYAAVLPRETARLTGLVEMVRDQELGPYGWGAWLEAPGSRLILTTEGLVILTGGPRVSHDCAGGAVALKQRLVAEGYPDAAIVTGWATDGIDEVFVRVGAGPGTAAHVVTIVPGRDPVDDPHLAVGRVLTAADEHQLAAFCRTGAILGGQGDRLYPMAVVPVESGDRMVFASITVNAEAVRLRFQTRAVVGAPMIRQLEVLVPCHEWRAWQALAGDLRPGDLMTQLRFSSRITTDTLFSVSRPRVAALASAILWKLDLTPRHFAVPEVAVNQGNRAGSAS